MVFILAGSISCKASFLRILFHSSPHYLKNQSKYLPHALSCSTSLLLLQALSALLSRVSPSSSRSLLSCRSYLWAEPATSVGCFFCAASPVPCTAFFSWLSVAGHQFTQYHLFCTYLISSFPSWVDIEYVKSADAMKLLMSYCIFLFSEKAGGNKRRGKSSQATKGISR